MRKKQRLALCLDGTWNNMDDSTNVFHHFALITEGDVAADGGTLRQKKYYHLGVGTGPLDRITGGGFGFGIEQNVRDAYNWLVQHYHDASDGIEADEIFIFGFSRGAYTARSLVGFISRCGLLRWGAPLTVRQLWQEYCLIGRQREERRSFWDSLFGEDSPSIREITDLVCDPWDIHEKAGTDSQEIPDLRVRDMKETERLLALWSRRVKITYLGVYDTVGAIGWDALAIPGLKSKLALHHNMRPTRLIQRCRHALAIDEHRSVFTHTPFVEYIGHQRPKKSAHAGEMANEELVGYWRSEKEHWRKRIEQRWFVGAHSNVGGGYSNNELAMAPFRWLFDGAKQAGLVSDEVVTSSPPKSKPVDSYREFAWPLWTLILRAKRNYRVMDPEPGLRASRKKVKQANNPAPGFSLATINEQVDETVFDHWELSLDCTPPPNLINYAGRALAETPPPSDPNRLQAIQARTPRHDWLGPGRLEEAALVVWATLGTHGLLAVASLARPGQDVSVPFLMLCLVAFGLTLIDWWESRTNFALALGHGAPWRRALGDSLYWLRAFGVVLFALGTVLAVNHLWRLGWATGSVGIVNTVCGALMPAIGVAAAAALGVIAGKFLDFASPIQASASTRQVRTASDLPPKRQWQFPGWLSGILVVAVGMPVLVFAAWLVGMVLAPALGSPVGGTAAAPPPAAFGGAGLLLILQWAVGYFLSACPWVGEPLSKANLGSIVRLQRCWSPAAVRQCLETWRKMLVCHWKDDDQNEVDGPAARAMRGFVREALWRDIIGFVPIYLGTLVLGLWFATAELSWDWLQSIVLCPPLWLFLPLATALADYAEDVCHLRYLTLHARGEAPSWVLTIAAFTMTLIKGLGFLAASVLVLAAIALGSLKCVGPDAHTGWRGTLAVSIAALAFLAVITIIVTTVYRRCFLKRRPSIPQ